MKLTETGLTSQNQQKIDPKRALSCDNMPSQEDFDFECKEEDNIREKFEIIGIQMDFHKTGILYLKELVFLTKNNKKSHKC